MRLEIFSTNFTRLYVPNSYPRSTTVFFIELTATLTKLCHISATIQFKLYAQNVHHRPNRTLAFSDIFPKQLGIFSTKLSFTRLLHVPVHARVQFFFIQLPPTATKLCHVKLTATTQRAFQPMDILSIAYEGGTSGRAFYYRVTSSKLQIIE